MSEGSVLGGTYDLIDHLIPANFFNQIRGYDVIAKISCLIYKPRFIFFTIIICKDEHLVLLS